MRARAEFTPHPLFVEYKSAPHRMENACGRESGGAPAQLLPRGRGIPELALVGSCACPHPPHTDIQLLHTCDLYPSQVRSLILRASIPRLLPCLP
eukprot:1788550-Pleurochrysis_carterae.AAC.1